MEAAGDAVTGAMLARAVEPDHGEAGVAHAGSCLNCGAPVSGNYCAQCGQATHLHRSFFAIGHDLAHGVLHFEGKIWTTLPELALRPGKLTRRYIHGERAKFVSPFALFLFSAFLMYAIFSLTSHHGGEPSKGPAMDRGAAAELHREAAKIDARIAKLERELAAPGLSQARRATLTEKLDDARDDRKGVGVASDISRSLEAEGLTGGVARTVGRAVNAAAENPDFAYYKLKANAYKFSWALILISLPFLWLLFPFSRRFKMYDHAVYITYSIAFMSLLFSGSMLLGAMGASAGLVTGALLLFALWHMYRQFKDAYALGRTGTLVRLPFLYLFACIALSLFFTMLVLMG
ncbi:DUF3667 domain-containing protein [Sphingobium amiense]|uniref:DUF3667 domain-containing protein n=2 Tax=Sphingobium amiense TaxID=135719 RepID=A0A494W3X4_9SPHN|nr:DUF3667 domain-containing protein [Sphingobium amiense]BBD99254.1 DUF3667 domain-containing protein [Sphingobium amiense]